MPQDAATSAYVIAPPAVTAVPVAGGGAFPVRRIFCVGRNYAAHAREMGSDPDRELPFFFCKPADALLMNDADMPYPPMSKDLHHEMELVVAIGTGGANIAEADALKHVWGYAAGLDMTRRDLQTEAKANGRPWDTAKGFDQSAVITELVRASEIGAMGAGAISLSVNGVEKQRGDLCDMIWNVAEIVANLSQLYHLQPGDLIYTGTPDGVGPVLPGDVITGQIAGLPELSLTIAARD